MKFLPTFTTFAKSSITVSYYRYKSYYPKYYPRYNNNVF